MIHEEVFKSCFNSKATYIRDYEDTIFWCVPMACHLLCNSMPRELSREGYTLPCPVVAHFGLRIRVTYTQCDTQEH